MPTLDIYVSVKYTYSGGNLHAQITYAPGEVGYDTLFNIVENTIIANPDSPPTSFGDINSATNYYYPANSASIKASMDTYTGLTWDIDLLIKEKPENWVIDFATENTVSTMDSRVTVVENGLSDGLFAINSALADHASDPGAHPELSAAIYASLGSMAYESAIDYYDKTATDALLFNKNYYSLTTKPAAKSFNNTPTITIQTTAAAANGDRLSTFRDAEVSYSVSIDTSVSLAGNSSGYVVLEIAASNSTTASDWKEINRVSSGQSGALVIGLTLNQTGGGNISGLVPAGYYRRLRKVNVAGIPTITLTGCQEVLDEPLQVAA